MRLIDVARLVASGLKGCDVQVRNYGDACVVTASSGDIGVGIDIFYDDDSGGAVVANVLAQRGDVPLAAHSIRDPGSELVGLARELLGRPEQANP